MRFPLISKLVFFISLVVMLSGCQSDLQKAEIAYKKGLYVESAEFTIKAYKKSPEKTQAFLSDKGAELLTRLKYQGEILMRRPTQDSAIRYYATLGGLFRELKRLGAEIPGLAPSIEDIEHKEKLALEAFLEQHYLLGEKALLARNYRESVSHFQAVQTFQPSYKNTNQLLQEASKNAFKTVAISPFFKHRDGIRASTFVRRADFVIPLKIQAIALEDTFMLTLLRTLDEKRSEFVSFTLDSEETPAPIANWTVEGHIDALEEWVPGFVDSEKKLEVLEYSYRRGEELITEKTTFSYVIYRKRYKISIEMLIRITPQDRPELARDIVVEEQVEDVKVYRDRSRDIPQNAETITYPLSYSSLPDLEPEINKEYVIRRAIDLAADKAASQILGLIEI